MITTVIFVKEVYLLTRLSDNNIILLEQLLT